MRELVADSRLLRSRHGDDEGVSHVSDEDRDAATAHSYLPRVIQRVRSGSLGGVVRSIKEEEKAMRMFLKR